jgi:exonuclease III
MKFDVINYKAAKNDDVTDLIPGDGNDFKFLSWNVRSIRMLKKFNRLKVYLDGLVSNSSEKVNAIDCLALTETWLNDSDNFNIYNLKNYNNTHLRRPNHRRGGGISFYARKPWIINVIESLLTDDVEFLHVEILREARRQGFLIVYRPPTGSMLEFLKWIDDYTQMYADLVIAGDMNINVAVARSCFAYLDVLRSNGYTILNNNVTREASQSIIDHVLLSDYSFSSSCKLAKVVTLRENAISDHNPILLVVHCCLASATWIKTTFKSTNYTKACEELSWSVNIPISLERVSPQCALDKFNDLNC